MTKTTISSGTTSSSSVTLAGGDSLVVSNGGTLAYVKTSQAITWSGGTSAPATIDIAGTVTAYGVGARGIDTGTPANGSILQIMVESTGRLSSDDDAIRIKNNFSGGTITIVNAGIIASGTLTGSTISTSGTLGSGQGLDFNAVTAATTVISITNQAGAIIGAADSDAIRGGADTLIYNYGTIEGQSFNGDTGNDGVDFQTFGAGTIDNYVTGLIEGARHGITGKLNITVDNAGTIEGHLGSGINMDTTSGTTYVTNETTGLIEGTAGTNADGSAQDGDGVDVDYLVDVENHGTIEAYGTSTGNLSEAVTVGGGTIHNYAGGLIESSQRGITVDNSNDGNAFGATTIINAGTIIGHDGDAISITSTFADSITNSGVIEGSIEFGAGNDTFNDYTGSTLTGLLDGGAGTDTLNLLGTGTGSVGNFTNFETLDAQGGSWTLTAPANLADIILAGGSLTLANSTAAAIGFTAENTTLGIETGAAATGSITGFDSTDGIDLAGFVAATTTLSFNNGTLTVSDTSGHSETLQLGGDYTGDYFHHAASGDGVLVTENTDAACYYPGTLIRTEAGDKPVETLAIGDVAVTADGRLLPIRWIGRNKVSTRFADPLWVLPIRIRAGALGENLPARDLLVSPEHAVLVDGILVQSAALVNGLSIVREANVPEIFAYYHVECAEHVMLLAEGAAAESFVDNVTRRVFENWAEYEALYGDTAIVEMGHPRVQSHRQVPAALRARLAARAVSLFGSGSTLAA